MLAARLGPPCRRVCPFRFMQECAAIIRAKPLTLTARLRGW